MSHIVKNLLEMWKMGLIPGSGKSPGEGKGNPLQYSFQENPVDRGAWWAITHGATKSDMTGVTKPTAHMVKASHSEQKLW